MKHNVGLDPPDHFDHLWGPNVGLMETKGLAPFPPGGPQVGQRPRGEVIDDVDLVVLGKEAVDEGGPDEPGTAGYQALHGAGTDGSAWMASITSSASPTAQPGPTTARSTWAAEATLAPSRSTDPRTMADSP